MKKRGIQLALLQLLLLLLVLPVSAHDDIRGAPECKYCGMYRHAFNYSRMLLERAGEAPVGTCSLNCAAVDYMRDLDNLPTAIKVADYNTKKLIDAKAAYWVIGGNKRGVMTARAKWAFKQKSDAQAFIKKHGGEPATFEDAIKASFEDLYKDMELTERHRFLHHADARAHLPD
jgi:copper chaperone NosL